MKTVKQLKEDLKAYNLHYYKNVYFCIYDTDGSSVRYDDKDELIEDNKYNDRIIQNIAIFHLSVHTAIDILLEEAK